MQNPLTVNMKGTTVELSKQNYQNHIKRDAYLVQRTWQLLAQYSKTSFFSKIAHPNRHLAATIKQLVSKQSTLKYSSQLLDELHQIKSKAEEEERNWNPYGSLNRIIVQLEEQTAPNIVLSKPLKSAKNY